MRRFAIAFLTFVSISGLLGQDLSPSMVVQSDSNWTFNHEVAFGGEGRWIAVASRDGQKPVSVIQIFDVSTGLLAQTIRDAEGRDIRLMASDPKRNQLAIVVNGGAVAIIDVVSGEQRWRFMPSDEEAANLEMSGLRYSADGLQLYGTWTSVTRGFASTKIIRKLYTWAIDDGRVLSVQDLPAINLRLGRIQSNGLFPSVDGRWNYRYDVSLTGKGNDKKVGYRTTIMDVSTGKEAGPVIEAEVIAAHAGANRALIRDFAGGDPSSVVKLLEVSTGKNVSIDADGTTGGEISPDGRTVVLAGAGIGWKVFDAQTGETRFPGSSSLPSTAEIVFSPDGSHFVAGLAPLVLVDIHDLAHFRALGADAPVFTTKSTGHEVRTALSKFGAPRTTPPSAAFTPDARWLITWAADGQLDFFDTATGNRAPFRVAIESDSNDTPLSIGSTGKFVYLWSEMKQRSNAKGFVFKTTIVDSTSGKVTATRQFTNVACASGEFALEYWATDKGVPTAVLKSINGVDIDLTARKLNWSAGCSISHNGRYLIVAGTSDRPPRDVPPPIMNMEALLFRGVPRKTKLVVYDVQAGRIVTNLLDERGSPGSFSFSAVGMVWTPDDRLVFDSARWGHAARRKGPVQVFDTTNGRQVKGAWQDLEASLLGLAPDGKTLITEMQHERRVVGESEEFGVDIRDAQTSRILYSLREVSLREGLVFSPNGKTIVAADRDGTLSVWRRSDGVRLGQLRALQEGEWLAVSSDGQFDGSPRAWSQISWARGDQTFGTKPSEIFFNEFYRPGLLADLLDARQIPAAHVPATIDRRQPAVQIRANRFEGGARIEVSVTEAPASGGYSKGSGVRDLRLFRNGQLIKAWRGNLNLDASGKVTVETTARLTAGANRFTAYAFNSDNVKSSDAEFALNVEGARPASEAYLLIVGINSYANPEFDLRYAAADADTISAGLEARMAATGNFTAIHRIDFRDNKATRENILLALRRLAGDSTPTLAGTPKNVSELSQLKPEDTLILFFAGHGIASGDRFYLIPHDLGFSGPRTEIRTNISEILKHGISDQDLERALEPIDARHIALIVDACQSGQALESDDDRRGPMNSRGLAQLAWEKGMSVLAASQAYQAALESSGLQHGFLTFALTEALETPVADTTPNDGRMTEAEWFEYALRRVPELQIEAIEKARLAGRKLNLELVPVGETSMRLQTPRLFTRQDLQGEPLVITKFQ